MKFDETRIQYHLSRRLLNKGYKIVLPNINWSWLIWEADLIGITKANYMYEYEIKITKQNFMKDFTKSKHRIMHRTPKTGNPRIPNYFSYVAPLNAMPICIPDNAGLIEVVKSGRSQHGMYFTEIRKPHKIHEQKVSEKGIIKMLRAMMFKYWDLAQTLENNKIQKELFN